MIHIKIKEKIKEWLFSSEMLRIKQLEKQIEESTNRLRLASIQLGNSEKEIEECRRLLTQFVDMGVDVGFHSDDHSWAVICIAGKPEYVKFMPLAHKDAKCVLDFLKQFQYSSDGDSWFEVIHYQAKCQKWKRLNHLVVGWLELPSKRIQ